MKYMDKADELAKEITQILKHNKYLLEETETLEIVLYARFLTSLGDAYREGKENSMIVNDLSSIPNNLPKGIN